MRARAVASPVLAATGFRHRAGRQSRRTAFQASPIIWFAASSARDADGRDSGGRYHGASGRPRRRRRLRPHRAPPRFPRSCRRGRQNTGGGGQHILFRENRDVPLRGSLGCGIDARYRGGIVVAPSIHSNTGRRYAWRRSTTRFRRCRPRTSVRGDRAGSGGQQDATLNGEGFAIGRLVGAGLMPRCPAIDCLTYAGSAMDNAAGRRPRWAAVPLPPA